MRMTSRSSWQCRAANIDLPIRHLVMHAIPSLLPDVNRLAFPPKRHRQQNADSSGRRSAGEHIFNREPQHDRRQCSRECERRSSALRSYFLYEARGGGDNKGEQKPESWDPPLIQCPQEFAVKHTIAVDTLAVIVVRIVIQHQCGAAAGSRTKEQLRSSPLFEVLKDVLVDAKAPCERSNVLDGCVVLRHRTDQFI